MNFRIVWITGLAALALLCFWQGLGGPMILDDAENLDNLHRFLDGALSGQGVIFGNRSGVLGRPVAMASFLFDTYVAGFDVWQFKFTNLFLHIVCGCLIMGLYSRLMREDKIFQPYIKWLPVFLGFIWMVLPIQTSTVLYIVQRMTQLSTLFVIAALLVYIDARKNLDTDKKHRGAAQLFLIVPALTALAVFSKENGFLLPLLALVIEVSYFSKSFKKSWGILSIFFMLSLVIPLLVVLVYVGVHFDAFLGGYAGRSFTLTERLLTETRIVWDYVGSIFLPYGPRMGLFHDNFPLSTSFFSPWTTALATSCWLLVLAIAISLRKQSPSIIAGLLLFLAGHAMESSVVPLELYFEHRNYLPTIGILLAMAGFAALLFSKVRNPTPVFKFAISTSLVVIALVYAAATFSRSIVWSSAETLYTQAVDSNPTSPRLRSDLALFNMHAGNLYGALANIEIAEKYDSPNELMTASLWRALSYCYAKQPLPVSLYDEMATRTGKKITLFGMKAWEMLALQAERDECSGLDIARLAAIGQQWVDNSSLPGTAHAMWRTRYYVARLLALQSNFVAAVPMADKAWRDSAKNNGVGVFLFQINATLGNQSACEEILENLKLSAGGADKQLDVAIQSFEAALRNHEIVPPKQ